MSTYESYVEGCDLYGDEMLVRDVMSQRSRIGQFAADYKNRCDILHTLEEQNAILKKQIEGLSSGNSMKRKELNVQLEESEYELNRTRKELNSLKQEVDKYKEYITQLEINNEYIKQQSIDNNILISESSARLEIMKQRLERLEVDIKDTEEEKDNIYNSIGNNKTINFAISRNLNSFEDLIKDVDRLRQENKQLQERHSMIQKSKNSIETTIQQKKEESINDEQYTINNALDLRNQLESMKEITSSQDKLIDTIQIDLETLREENAYLTERLRKRNISSDV